MDTNVDGALAAALAAAQAAFPPISRDKEVTVQTKTGGSYKFKYAPLDSILNAVRKPLADNGLAIAQLLDDGELVTMLMHKDGGRLSGRVALPSVDGVQAFGSAITYLRRYSLQAILGIAAEEDDDGNHASGNTTTFGGRQERPVAARGIVQTDAHPIEPVQTNDGGLIGIAKVGNGKADFELRQSPEGPAISFRLAQGRQGIKVVATGELAEAIAAVKPTILDQRVTVWGSISDEEFTKDGRTIRYQVMTLDRIATPDGILRRPDAPEVDEPPDDVPLFAEMTA